MNNSSRKNTGKGIGLVMRSRILSTMLVLGCTAPIATAPVLQPLTVYAEETTEQQNENTPEGTTGNEAAAGNAAAAESEAPADNQGETTSVTGQIVFAGTEQFPASITVNLLANNVICNTIAVTPETKWAFTFQDLPLTDADGAAVIYSVDEVVPEGFVKTITGTTITNTKAEAAKAAEEQKAAEDGQKTEEEQQTVEGDKKSEEEQKAAEEDKKSEQEQKAAEEKKAEEEKKAAEEAKKAEEEKKAAEEAKKAEEEKKAAEEAKKAEEEKKAAEEAKKAEEEKKAAEQDKKIEDANATAKKAEEDAAAAKKEAEDAKKAAEEAKKTAAEADKKAEEAKKAAEEAKGDSEKAKKAEEAKKKAEEKAKKAEEAKKKAEEKAKKAEEAKKKAEEKAKKTEHLGLKWEGYKETGNSAQNTQPKVNSAAASVPAEQQKYVYVTVKYVVKDQQTGNSILADYRDQIAAQTANGYHYVGYIPAELDASGKMVSIDLVFEKD